MVSGTIPIKARTDSASAGLEMPRRRRVSELLRRLREIARRLGLTDRPGSGRYRTAVGANVRGGWSLPRADLASFIVTHLDDPTTSRMTVAVAS